MLVLFLCFLLSVIVSAQDKDICSILAAKCEASCIKNNNKQNCISSCIDTRATWKKPGDCPVDENEGDIFGLACLEACRYDAECPYVGKCCPNTCGITCQQPVGLDHQIDLPAKPHDITVISKRKGAGKGSLIRWTKPNENVTDPDVIYVVEGRFHVGRHFSEPRLSEWTTWPATTELLEDNKSIGLRLRGLKLGTWYEFRVAAVNDIGSRGFSEPSLAFTPSGAEPKPPSMPQNFHANLIPGKQDPSWILKWDKPAHSDLPVQRYKVFWSRRYNIGSLLVHHHTLPSGSSSYTLDNLLPDSLYFLQVQALAQFGKARLKSEKASIVLNTTLSVPHRKKRYHHHW